MCLLFVCVVCSTVTLCTMCLYSLFVPPLQNEMILMVGRKEANDGENEYGFHESILYKGSGVVVCLVIWLSVSHSCRGLQTVSYTHLTLPTKIGV